MWIDIRMIDGTTKTLGDLHSASNLHFNARDGTPTRQMLRKWARIACLPAWQLSRKAATVCARHGFSI